MGNTSAIKWFEGIGECKNEGGPGYRIYLAKSGDSLIVLFGGGTKKNLVLQRAPRRACSRLGTATGVRQDQGGMRQPSCYADKKSCGAHFLAKLFI